MATTRGWTIFRQPGVDDDDGDDATNFRLPAWLLLAVFICSKTNKITAECIQDSPKLCGRVWPRAEVKHALETLRSVVTANPVTLYEQNGRSTAAILPSMNCMGLNTLNFVEMIYFSASNAKNFTSLYNKTLCHSFAPSRCLYMNYYTDDCHLLRNQSDRVIT